MAKFLLVIAVFIVVYLLLRNVASKQGASTARDSASSGATSKKSASQLTEDMVRCGVCGVHLPTSEAITSRGDFFCSKEHLQLAVRERDSR